MPSGVTASPLGWVPTGIVAVTCPLDGSTAETVPLLRLVTYNLGELMDTAVVELGDVLVVDEVAQVV
jgi:hypothetical protein